MNALTPHALLQQAPGAPLDADPEETAEWRDAFLALVATEGPERARATRTSSCSMCRARSALAGSPT
jgi:pyruvate dehydrogenase E1 component